MAQLESGKPHSLKEIFCGENDKIIVPDLQRDYCWGDHIPSNSTETLVSSFMDSLLKLDRSRDITMGLIYGYYDKELTPNHLQLCDGQQRLTTLFLILGVLNRKAGDDRYKDILISNFELEEDDKEPHLLYGIRESSLYFLSDLTIYYFLNSNLSLSDLDKQPWFLNSYNNDPTIISIKCAIETIEAKLASNDDNEKPDIYSFGDFLIERLKFLFYDMNNRLNGEETFVVINTTGEPLTANQNLKPLIIKENESYTREEQTENGQAIIHTTAEDWETMETWFWQKRHINDSDTSTEGMLAFFHCVRILENDTEEGWHKHMETENDDFPLTIPMERIWEWFYSYKRLYELNYKRLTTPNIRYPESRKHYTQKDLYALLPSMEYCRKYPDATEQEIQRIYHLFSNMSRYRDTNRSSQKESLRVPAFRAYRLIRETECRDVLSLLGNQDFNVEEERQKMIFIQRNSPTPELRMEIEELFAKAESFPIYKGRIATLVSWSEDSLDRLRYLYGKIKEWWIDCDNQNRVRQALLASKTPGYPAARTNSNRTLCTDEEWSQLFERQGEHIVKLLDEGNLDTIIEKYKDPTSPYFPLINDISYLNFAQKQNIRILPQEVIELMEKKTGSGNYIIFHKCEVFRKNTINSDNWTGLNVWPDRDGNVTYFYTQSIKYNLTLDMRIDWNGYRIIAHLDREPAKKSLDTTILKEQGFIQEKGIWSFPYLTDPIEAKHKYIDITKAIEATL